MTDHLIRAVELLAKIAERLAMVDARLGEGVERIAAAVAALSKQLTAGGVRAGKAERALGEKVEALPTSEAIGVLFADLRAREDERHGAQIAVLAALAGWLGGQVPTLPGRAEQTPPTAVLPGAGSRLMGDRRLADGSEG